MADLHKKKRSHDQQSLAALATVTDSTSHPFANNDSSNEEPRPGISESGAVDADKAEGEGQRERERETERGGLGEGGVQTSDVGSMVSGQAGRDTGRLGAEALALTRSKLDKSQVVDDLDVAQEDSSSSSIGGLSALQEQRAGRYGAANAMLRAHAPAAGRRLTVSEASALQHFGDVPAVASAAATGASFGPATAPASDVASSVRSGDVEEVRRGAGRDPEVMKKLLRQALLGDRKEKVREELVPHESRPAPPANVRVAGSFDGSVSADFAHEPDRFAGAADWEAFSRREGGTRDIGDKVPGVEAIFRRMARLARGSRTGREEDEEDEAMDDETPPPNLADGAPGQQTF